MVGGDETAFLTVEPLLKCFSKSITYMGKSGMGQRAKMANQICIAGIVQSLAEAIRFAERSGLDVEKTLNALAGGAAGSWQLNNRGITMHNRSFDFGFAVDWFRKDLKHVLNEARANGSSLPLTALVDQLYSDLQASGDGRLDTSSLIKRLP